MTPYKDLKTKIVEKLSGIENLKYVYNFEKSELSGFPTATISRCDFINPWESQNHDSRTFTFFVRIYQEMSREGQGEEKAEEIIDNLIDIITNAFAADYTLSGVANGGVIIEGASAWIDREIPCRVLEFRIVCKKLVLIS